MHLIVRSKYSEFSEVELGTILDEFFKEKHSLTDKTVKESP